MPITAIPQPTDGGDYNVWGPKQLAQNHLALGLNSTKLYISGSLYLSPGMIGFYNGSQYYAVSNSAALAISVAGLTASCWAQIELQVPAGVPAIIITSIGGATSEANLPSAFTGSYDGTKGGRYLTATKRMIGIVWINAAGVPEGIINGVGGSDSYKGYSTSNDAFDFLYNFTCDNGNLIPPSCYVPLTAGAGGVRLTMPSAPIVGTKYKISHIDAGAGAVTIWPNAGETFGGMSFLFLTEQEQNVEIVWDGSNYHIISGVLFWITGGRNTANWTNHELGMERITYNANAGGTILIGETVTETETGYTFIIIANTGTVLTCIKATGKGWVTNNNHLTFSQSGHTALVSNAGTDKDVDTSMYHNTGLNAFRFDIEIWQSDSTTFSWTNAKRIGRFRNNVQANSGVEVINIDTNTFKLQSGANSTDVIKEDGTANVFSVSDISYNVVAKLVF
jgi:hypothetical protein